nr:DUF6668 family protein [Kibdelosporangium sp. MJ126-NF4]CEL15623.1 hypothetical protein [Kibdelosporangium sp. MJ126-NF4]CTQ90338.1 hypothetical protein [Kibdelosporangium sp. MJ126-NF4]
MNAAMVTSAADLWVRGPVTAHQRPAGTPPHQTPGMPPGGNPAPQQPRGNPGTPPHGNPAPQLPGNPGTPPRGNLVPQFRENPPVRPQQPVPSQPPIAPRLSSAGPQPGISWLGAHGGAGTTTLAEALSGRDVGTRWPDLAAGEPGQVIVVARTNAAGLRAASQVLDALRTGRHPDGVVLVALVLVADAPGRLPHSLARRVRVLRSVADTIRVPWVPAWRAGEAAPKPPKEMAKLADLVQSRSHA